MKCRLVLGVILACAAANAAEVAPLRLQVRTRVEAFKGSGEWHEVQI